MPLLLWSLLNCKFFFRREHHDCVCLGNDEYTTWSVLLKRPKGRPETIYKCTDPNTIQQTPRYVIQHHVSQ